jgi:hypothetical protein
MSNKTLNLGQVVQLDLLEKGTAAAYSEGDLKLRVSINFEGWSGSYDAVYIASADWRTFLSALITLERDRRGKAVLYAMSPDEFELHFEIISPAGRLAIHGFLATYHWARGSPTLRSRIEYFFEIDPSLLRILKNEFVDLPT